jgi:hypothetical protein
MRIDSRAPASGKRQARFNRKEFLSLLGISATGLSLGACPSVGTEEAVSTETTAKEPSMEERVAEIIRLYDAQGIHRTGTPGDQACARWLAGEVRRLGVEASLEELPFEKIEVAECSLRIGERRIAGVPLFNAPATGPEGLTGTVGSDPSGAATLGFLAVAPNGTGGGALRAYREATSQVAVIAVVGGERFGMPPGPALLNAESYSTPSGPPTIQVPGETLELLQEAAVAGTEVRFFDDFEKRSTEVYNTTATIRGRDESLAPLVVMTPRSGWWRCASERGGGIAVWLEMIRALERVGPERSAHFVASTGHELGHYGLEHYLKQRHDLIAGAVAWIHLGANFGAAVGPGVLFQSSDEEARRLGLEAMSRYGRQPERETLPGDRPLGEARNIFDGGGRYLSLLGRNGLFHHPDDRWPEAVDVGAVAAFASAFADVAVGLAHADAG